MNGKSGRTFLTLVWNWSILIDCDIYEYRGNIEWTVTVSFLTQTWQYRNAFIDDKKLWRCSFVKRNPGGRCLSINESLISHYRNPWLLLKGHKTKLQGVVMPERDQCWCKWRTKRSFCSLRIEEIQNTTQIQKNHSVCYLFYALDASCKELCRCFRLVYNLLQILFEEFKSTCN